MKTFPIVLQILVLAAFTVLFACGGGGGGGSTPITSFELFDPTPEVRNFFGTQVIILANGNIVVTDPGDSSVTVSNGAVHLYNPATQTRVASIYGDDANDQLGSGGVTALANGNYVIVSTFDTVGGVAAAGSVRLVNGTTGVQISMIAGDNADDFLGFGGVSALANGNYVIVSPSDTVGGLAGAGSVMLVNGTTGVQIGSTLSGDNALDELGSGGVTALANGNYVIVSPNDAVGGLVNAGSVRLINGTTGVQIGSAIAGDNAGDALGFGRVTALANGNYVIVSQHDDVGGVVDAGSVKLVDGATGVQIGSTLTGDNANDLFGSGGATALANGNYVIVSPNDAVGGLQSAGSVRLINGTTGVQIGSPIAGDNADDFLGSGRVTALSTGNYVIVSPNDAVGGLANAGSVRLVDGATGVPIGSTLTGNSANDSFGSGGVTALANGNYVIVSPSDDVSGVVDAGSVRLVNGTTGVQIGSPIAGDDAGDALGSRGVTPLANGNYVIVSPSDDVGGVIDAGSVRLVNGTTGVPIGSPIAGEASGDVKGAVVTGSATGDFFVLGLPAWDKNGVADSGLARLIAP